MFTIKGRYSGKVYNITWDNGKIYGDEVLADVIKDYIEAKEGEPVGFPGYYFTDNHIKNAFSSYLILRRFFDEVIEESGDIPAREENPYGVCD